MWKKATFSAPKPAHPLFSVVPEGKPAPTAQQNPPPPSAKTQSTVPASLEATTIENLKNELFELKKINSYSPGALKSTLRENVEMTSEPSAAKPKAYVHMPGAEEKPVYVTVQEKVLKADGTVGEPYQPN